MGDDPWMGVNRRYPQGTRMFGKITNIADYGAFVELEPGIEGLVHVSEMDWIGSGDPGADPRRNIGGHQKDHGGKHQRERQMPHPDRRDAKGWVLARHQLKLVKANDDQCQTLQGKPGKPTL